MADAPSTPTFPYDGPFRPPGGGGTGGEEATVTLSSDASTVQVGDEFTVDIRIATVDARVNDYKLVIDYDPTKLTVVDNDPAQNGIQIRYLDTFYQASTNSVSTDTTTNQGRVSLEAEVPGGSTASTINRRVAQITFRASANGSAQVSVRRSDSFVNNNNDQDILNTVNNVTFTIGGQATTTTTTSTVTSTITSTITSTNTITSTATSTLPDSGITDITGTAASAIMGVVMMIIGAFTLLKKKRQKFWPR